MERFDSCRSRRQPRPNAERIRARQAGQAAEEAAVRFLEGEGLALVVRNWRRRTGELDVVVRAPHTMIVVEVRTRSNQLFGGAAASVDSRKRRRILRTTAQLIQARKDLAALPVRFDVLIVHAPLSERPQFEWIRHAF